MTVLVALAAALTCAAAGAIAVAAVHHDCCEMHLDYDEETP